MTREGNILAARIENERGGAILLVLVVLLSLGLLSSLWLAVSSADLLIGAAQRGERRRYYAAEGALETVLSHLAGAGAGLIPPETLRAGVADFATPEQRGHFSSYPYRWQAAFVSAGGEGGRTAALRYSRAAGYEGSPFAAEGFPVVRISLSLDGGSGKTLLRADVTPRALNMEPRAAWASAGPALFEGAVTISGRDHDRDGRIGETLEGHLPGVMAGGPVHLAAGAVVAGSPGQEILLAAEGFLPVEPIRLLGAGDTITGLDSLPPPPADGSCIDGIVAVSRDFAGPLCGRGAIVVHNPRFDPVRFEASRLFAEEGRMTDDFDLRYSHLDPGNQPAQLDLSRGGVFRGLAAADAFAAVYGRSTIIGAVVTFSRSPATTRAEAPLNVLFSRAALSEAALGPLSHRLGSWSPVGAIGLLGGE